jgi:hypothetical protein
MPIVSAVVVVLQQGEGKRDSDDTSDSRDSDDGVPFYATLSESLSVE